MPSPYTPVSPGTIDNAGDRKALFLKVFTGEVLQTFQTACVTLPLIRTRTISSGKSAQFVVTGRVTGAYHTPGTEINGQAVRDGEKIINIDDLYTVGTFHANIDEAMAQWDTRGPVSQEHGNELARKMDRDNLITIINSARSAGNLTGNFAGTVLNRGATVATTASAVLSAIETAGQSFDEKDIANEGRVLLIRPAQFWLLVSDAKVANKWFGGVGNISSGTVPEYAGFNIIKSNRIPNTNIATGATGENNAYTGDYTNTVMTAFTPDAMGRVTLIGVKTESEYSVRTQGTLLVSKYASGSGVLRPECALEITKT